MDPLADKVLMASAFVMLMQGLEGLAKATVAQQLGGVAGVLSQHQVYLAKHLDSPGGKVTQVSNGRGDDIEGTSGNLLHGIIQPERLILRAGY